MEDKVRSQSEKIQAILSKLEKAREAKSLPKKLEVKTNTQNIKNKQTVSDDFHANKDKEKQIYLYEEIIRSTLSMFNISYDDLIRMDGKSAYCKAVEFYPYLLDEVKKSDCPPLYALAISKSMQPYLEFTEKYGSSIDEIKQNLKEELKKENQEAVKKIKAAEENEEKSPEPSQASIFADIESAITKNSNKKPSKKNDDSLASLFAN